MTTNAAVGPVTWTRDPPSNAATAPPTMAVYRPCWGGTPTAIASAIDSGSATIPTTSPASTSCRRSSAEYPSDNTARTAAPGSVERWGGRGCVYRVRAMAPSSLAPTACPRHCLSTSACDLQHVREQRLRGHFRSRSRPAHHERLGVVAAGGESEEVVCPRELCAGMIGGERKQPHCRLRAFSKAGDVTQDATFRSSVAPAALQLLVEHAEMFEKCVQRKIAKLRRHQILHVHVPLLQPLPGRARDDQELPGHVAPG